MYICIGGPRILWFLVRKGYYDSGIMNSEDCLFSIKPQNGSKKFTKSPFSAVFHKISIFESQNVIVRIILTYLSIYLSKFGLFNSILRGFFNLHNCNSTIPSWTLSGHNCTKIWKFSIFICFFLIKLVIKTNKIRKS